MVVMRKTFLSVLGTVFVALSTLKYHFQTDEKTENGMINPQFQRQSQENNKDWGKFPTALVGQKNEVFSRSCLPMASVCGFAGLAVGGLTAIVVACKCKRDRAALQKTITLHQKELQNKDKDLHDMSEVSTSLKDQKTELEQQRDRLRGELEEVEAEKEENKKKLHSVETEITEKEMTFEKPEELLKEKENLLQAQWKLDEKKKNFEKQKISIEKLLEPLELHVSRMNRRRDGQIWSD